MKHVEIRECASAIRKIDSDARLSEVTGSFARPERLCELAVTHGLHINEAARDAVIAAAYPIEDSMNKNEKASVRTRRSTAALVMKYADKAESIKRVCETAFAKHGAKGSGGELWYTVTRRLKENGKLPDAAEFAPKTKADPTRVEYINSLIQRGERLLKEAANHKVRLSFGESKVTAEDLEPAAAPEPPPAPPAPPAPTAPPAADPMLEMMRVVSQLAAEVAALKAK